MSWMSLIRSIGWVALASCMLAGCGTKGSEPPSAQVLTQDAAWQNIITAHTTGIVSRHAKIRVVFAGDVATAAARDHAVPGVLALEPSVAGVTRFVGTREIAFTPGKDLQPGKTYRVRVLPKNLVGVPASLRPFEFDVQVQDPGLEVDVKGLSPELDINTGVKRQFMELRGTITTADVENVSRVERLIKASYLGRTLPLVWHHEADSLHHQFTVAGIARQPDAQAIRLTWDGAAIGASTRGAREIAVPPRDQFVVTHASVTTEGSQRYITVRFSDTLNTRQDLRGLVTLSTGKFTMRMDRNVLKIFPENASDGEAIVALQPGIRSADGERLPKAFQYTVTFESTRPQVRFVGTGVILPPSQTISVPFEAVNVRAVRVTAFEVHEENIGQFLQVNTLSGNSEMGRVGRHLWRKRIALTAVEPGRWNRYNLDLSELFSKHPHALIQLTLSVQRSDSTYKCANAADEAVDAPLGDQEDNDISAESNWDYAEEYYGAPIEDGSKWSDRDNPCTDAYFRYSQGTKQARNFLASNIGLTAKRDQFGQFLIAATDLRTSQPLAGLKIDLRNFQNGSVGTVMTDGSGLARITPTAAPFALFAAKGAERGYLKVSRGTSLPVSHFDTGGEIVSAGIKGILYGERGVWRPGDSIYLTFVLQDLDKRLPPDHPVTLELYNPRGQRVQSITNAKPMNGFYAFTLATDPDAPTGDWTARAILGGATFTKTLKIETVMPNRLKIDLDVGDQTLRPRQPVKAKLSSAWLTGAVADGLNAEVSVRLSTTPTRFDRFADYVFDDPAREMKPQTSSIFSGKLDTQGRVAFESPLEPSSPPPGMLLANFTTRVFERGGAFSTSHTSASLAPYERFIGIKLPKGDAARGMLMTDETQTVEIASLSFDGKPVDVENIHITMYQVEWRWWWDQSGDSLAQYAQASQSSIVQEGKVSTKNGHATWDFKISYPQWGRFLIRACDEKGGHCTGKTVYIDWPSWAGRRQEQAGPAASALTLTADKDQYTVGDVATIQLPEASQGRALMTVESGTSILQARWLALGEKQTRFTVPITRDMSPNVYVSVTLIQPHENKDNDRPIRLYGIIPLKVIDPKTYLKPVIHVANEWRPESTATVEVAEASGRDMTYTLAVVDEGLLGLTSYKTPNLHDHFYKREALGIATWDLFDDVVGAYGAQLERLLALGGSDKTEVSNPDDRQSRFPPVVKVLGPFTVQGGRTDKREVELPPYVGAVRVMVVAGNAGAYGSAEKSVFVRQPLMILPTLPRVIGPNEEAAVPVSLFVMDESIKQVTLKAETDGLLQLEGEPAVTVSFDKPGDKIGLLKVKAAARLGQSHIRFVATSGAHHAQADVYIDVRSSNPPTTVSVSSPLKPGERWKNKVVPHGLSGTNVVTLEVSATPPMGLERRLDYLIHYPYGCVEQTTSSVFPQLYLPTLMKLEDSRRQTIEQNVRAGIQRLRLFQLPSGAFTYWPGGFFGGMTDNRGAWATNYVGHFLLEADRVGYTVPPDMLNDWLKYQASAASSWVLNKETSTLDQAYRLYTLALANRAEIGAMNRLRETSALEPTDRWLLAAAYKLAGMTSVAEDLIRGLPLKAEGSSHRDEIFGSELRDSAIVLDSVRTLGHTSDATALMSELAARLNAEDWYSTQSIAYSLMAIAKFTGGTQMQAFQFKHDANTVESTSPIYSEVLKGFKDEGETLSVENTSDRMLFVTVFDRGVPAAGNDDEVSKGLSLDVRYSKASGEPVDISSVPQGTDLIAEISVRNLTQHRIDNIALAQIVPAGWEIENERLNGGDAKGEREASDKRVPGWLYIPDGSPSATTTRAEYVDIRDDRIYRYFGLKADEAIYFRTRLNAAYRGHYYLPSLSVEAMYDATKVARTRGRWIDVTAKEH